MTLMLVESVFQIVVDPMTLNWTVLPAATTWGMRVSLGSVWSKAPGFESKVKTSKSILTLLGKS